jgi:putative ABC transport system permease protein
MLPTAPDAVSALSDVSWALGLGAAVDVHNPALTTARAGSREIVGALPPDLTLVQGRLPRPGEAIAGAEAAEALRLGPGLGRIQSSDEEADPVGVVGVFTAAEPLAHLNDLVLIAAEPGEPQSLRYLYVMARDVSAVERLERVLATSTPAATPSALIIETPSGAIAVRDVIAGRLGAASRQLMAVVMGVGAVITAATMLSATIARRRDLGRRRALGASRSVLVATLLIEASVGTVLGIAVGTSAGVATLAATTGMLPTWQFIVGTAGLGLLLTVASAAPIAAHAAHRDPLRILRVP